MLSVAKNEIAYTESELEGNSPRGIQPTFAENEVCCYETKIAWRHHIILQQTHNGETELESKRRTKINVAILAVLEGDSPEYLLTEKKIHRVPSQNTSINRVTAQVIHKAVRSMEEPTSVQRLIKKYIHLRWIPRSQTLQKEAQGACRNNIRKNTASEWYRPKCL